MRGHYEIEGNLIRVSFRDERVSIWIIIVAGFVVLPYIFWKYFKDC